MKFEEMDKPQQEAFGSLFITALTVRLKRNNNTLSSSTGSFWEMGRHSGSRHFYGRISSQQPTSDPIEDPDDSVPCGRLCGIVSVSSTHVRGRCRY